jgi:hypothetical protein
MLLRIARVYSPWRFGHACHVVAPKSFSAAWPPQPQAPEPEDSLEVGKQHLDLFPAAASSLIFRCRGESPGNVASLFVQITRNLAGDRIRAATRLEFTNVTILLAGAREACAFGSNAGPRGSVGAPELDQLFATRARISIPFGIKWEVGARKRPSGWTCRRQECGA